MKRGVDHSLALVHDLDFEIAAVNGPRQCARANTVDDIVDGNVFETVAFIVHQNDTSTELRWPFVSRQSAPTFTSARSVVPVGDQTTRIDSPSVTYSPDAGESMSNSPGRLTYESGARASGRQLSVRAAPGGNTTTAIARATGICGNDSSPILFEFGRRALFSLGCDPEA